LEAATKVGMEGAVIISSGDTVVTALPPTSGGEDVAGSPDWQGHRPFCSSRAGIVPSAGRR
jgi:hypothetical protein